MIGIKVKEREVVVRADDEGYGNDVGMFAAETKETLQKYDEAVEMETTRAGKAGHAAKKGQISYKTNAYIQDDIGFDAENDCPLVILRKRLLLKYGSNTDESFLKDNLYDAFVEFAGSGHKGMKFNRFHTFVDRATEMEDGHQFCHFEREDFSAMILTIEGLDVDDVEFLEWKNFAVTFKRLLKFTQKDRDWETLYKRTHAQLDEKFEEVRVAELFLEARYDIEARRKKEMKSMEKAILGGGVFPDAHLPKSAPTCCAPPPHYGDIDADAAGHLEEELGRVCEIIGVELYPMFVVEWPDYNESFHSDHAHGLFEALSFAAFGTEIFATLLQQNVLKEIVDNRKWYEKYFNEVAIALILRETKISTKVSARATVKKHVVNGVKSRLTHPDKFYDHHFTANDDVDDVEHYENSDPSEVDKYSIFIKVVSCSKLIDADGKLGGKSDPFVQLWLDADRDKAKKKVEAAKSKQSRFAGALGFKDVTIGSIGNKIEGIQRVRTKIINETDNPEFNEVFEFPFSEVQRQNFCANLEVMDADNELKMEGADDFLGAIEIDIMDLGIGVHHKKTYNLLGVKRGKITVETFVTTACAHTNIEVFAAANLMKRPIMLLGSDEDVAVYGVGFYGASGVYAPYRHEPKDTSGQPLVLGWGQSYCPQEKPALLPLTMVDSDLPEARPWPLDVFQPPDFVMAHDPFKKNGMHKKLRKYVSDDHSTVCPPDWIYQLVAAVDHINQLPITERGDMEKVGPFLDITWFQDDPEHATGVNAHHVVQKNDLNSWLQVQNLPPSIYEPALGNTSVYELCAMSQADLAYLPLSVQQIEDLGRAIHRMLIEKGYVDRTDMFMNRVEDLKNQVGTLVDEDNPILSHESTAVGGYEGENVGEWLESETLEPDLLFFLESDGVSTVSQLVTMSDEDIMEKPDGVRLKAAIDKLRVSRASGSGGGDSGSGGYAGEDISGWLSSHSLDPDLEFFLMSDGVTTVSQLLSMSEEDVSEKTSADQLRGAIDKLRADRQASVKQNNEVHAGEDLKAWLAANNLDPDLEFFLNSDDVNNVSGLLHMKDEDIVEKPDHQNLRAAIERLRAYREELQLNYEGDDIKEWLKVNDLPPEFEALLAADGATTVAAAIKLKKKQIEKYPAPKKLRGAIAMRQARIKASKRRKQNFREVYVYEDPTGSLPDEVIMQIAPGGVIIFPADANGGVKGKKLFDWRRETIVECTGLDGLEDGGDSMDIISWVVMIDGTEQLFTFEVEEYEPLKIAFMAASATVK